MKFLIPLFASCLLLFSSLYAQQPPGACPGGTVVLSGYCSTACVLCDIDGYSGANSGSHSGPDESEAPDSYCAPQLHSVQWLGFVAGSTEVTFSVDIFSCQLDNEGLQIGIFGTVDCSQFTSVANCEPALLEGDDYEFIAENLTPGQTYFFVIDGVNGDVCNFTINVTAGSVQAPPVTQPSVISGPTQVCQGAAAFYNATEVAGANAYTWTLEGQEVGYLPQVEVTFPIAPGNYNLCVTPSNPCAPTGPQSCTTVTVQSSPAELFTETICQGDSFSYQGQAFYTTGFYEYGYYSGGCFQPVQVDLTVGPISEEFLDVDLCEDEVPYQVGIPGSPGAMSFSETTGDYVPVVLQNQFGCDSTVFFNLTVHPLYATTDIQRICEGESYTVSDGIDSYTFTETSFEEINLQSSEGCDSTVFLNLQVFPQPEPVYLDEIICRGEIYEVGDFLFFSQTGLYEATLESYGGCDSLITLNLVVIDSFYTDLDITICEGEDYPVDTFSFTDPGFYPVTLQSLQYGCDSIVNLYLDVLPTLYDTVAVAICEGASYDFGGQAYAETGIYETTMTGANGCDSIVTLQLAVIAPVETFLVEEICFGSSFAVADSAYTETGNYTNLLTAASGCDSIVYLDLTVSAALLTSIEASICTGETYTLGNATYSDAGMYEETLLSSDGCDSVLQLTLQVIAPITTPLTAEICEADTFLVGNSSYTSAGTYRDTLVAASGCDSIVILDLTTIPPIATAFATSICEGEVYTFGTSDYSIAGQYTETFTAASGCDSIVLLDLMILPTLDGSTSATICAGETYPFGSNDYAESGIYLDTLVADTGCDSVVTLDLTVIPPVEADVVASICEGSSYQLGNNQYMTAGVYRDTLTALNGCDSIVNLELTVTSFYETNLVTSICVGDSVVVGTTAYTETGQHSETFLSQEGCDSIVNLDLTILPVITTALAVDICVGQSYPVGESAYTATGNYVDTLLGPNGCDSIVRLDLTVVDQLTTEINDTICPGQFYTFGGAAYTAAGIYRDTLVAQTGCDSLVILDLWVSDILETTVEVVLCPGESYDLAGVMLTESGTYVDSLITDVGCDSIVSLNLMVLPENEETVVASICEGGAYQVGNSTYDMTGIYQDTLMATSGCDSVVVLDLTVTSFYETNLVESICTGDSVVVGMTAYTETGQYSETFLSQEGCDSIVNLDLVVLPIITTDLTINICSGESYVVGTSEYTIAGNYVDTLIGPTGCDSIVRLELAVTDQILTDISATICPGQAYNFGGEFYAAAGTYTDTLSSQAGCDSLVTLDLSVNDVLEEFLTVTICAGENYDFQGDLLSTSGNYADSLLTPSGCDSIIYLDLTVLANEEETIVASICDGGTYQVGTSVYDMTGQYQDTLTSVAGCDSIVALDLTVTSFYEVNLVESICPGESVLVGTTAYTETGQYSETFLSQEGCDSIVNLDLTVLTIVTTDLVVSICTGQSYTVGTSEYTAAGSYMDTLTSSNGCDSIVQLELSITDQLLTELDATICLGETYDFGGESYAIAGIYTDSLQTINGCDSLVMLDLIVNDTFLTNITASICADEGYEIGGETYTEAGIYTIPLITVNGCDSTLILDLSVNSCDLSLNSSSQTVSCFDATDGFISFSVATGTPPYTYTWQQTGGGVSGSGSMDNNDETVVLNDLAAGDYQVVVTDANAIATTATFQLSAPEAIQITAELAQYGGFNVSCVGMNDGAIALEVTGGAVPYNYAWEIGTDGPILDNIGAGNYEVTVTDQNGCSAIAAITLIAPPGFAFDIQVTEPDCFGDNDLGSIEVANVSGGVTPFLFSLNNESFSESTSFPNLPSGAYQLTIEDANGCNQTEQIVVQAPEELVVDLGQDFSMLLGETGELLAQTSHPVDSFVWSSTVDFSCLGDSLNTNCEQIQTTPMVTASYQVMVIDDNGCAASDQINIIVDKERRVFIPNIFSPSSKNGNELFTIFGGEDVLEIQSFSVYDRWGSMLYHHDTFQPNDPTVGWDGRHRGQPLSSGVYIYFAKIAFIDGEVMIFKGDVTLLR